MIVFFRTQEDQERVDTSGGIKASLQGRYASALFDLAVEQGTVSAVESDLAHLARALDESRELRALIANPRLSRKALGEVVATLARALELNDLTARFLGVLAQNRRLAALEEIIAAFGEIAAAQRGEVTAKVVSAHPLAEEQIARLQDKLRAREGRTVKIRTSVDPSLLGGLVVTLGSKRIDGSIRTRLNLLAASMKAATP